MDSNYYVAIDDKIKHGAKRKRNKRKQDSVVFIYLLT